MMALSPAQEQRLAQLIVSTGQSRDTLLLQLESMSLDDLEDYYCAAGVMARVRQGKEALHSLDDVERELGLE